MNRSCVFLSLAFFFSCTANPQEKSQQSSKEQTSFSMEFPFEHPAKLSSLARAALAAIPEIAERVKEEGTTPEEMPKEWFEVSEVPLGTPGPADLVVMGVDGFLGANITPFWVLRQNGKAYKLVLTIPAHDLEILNSKTCDLRDIRVEAFTAVWYFENVYKYNCSEYRVAVKRSGPIGEELPKNLNGYETRKPLVQGSSESPERVLNEARAWLWKQWWLEKQSILSVTLYSKEGDRTTTTYFVTKDSGKLRLLIRTQRWLVDREPHAGTRRPVLEDALVVAEDIERRFALSGEASNGIEVPEAEDPPGDRYQLRFSDAGGDEVGVL